MLVRQNCGPLGLHQFEAADWSSPWAPASTTTPTRNLLRTSTSFGQYDKLVEDSKQIVAKANDLATGEAASTGIRGVLQDGADALGAIEQAVRSLADDVQENLVKYKSKGTSGGSTMEEGGASRGAGAAAEEFLTLSGQNMRKVLAKIK